MPILVVDLQILVLLSIPHNGHMNIGSLFERLRRRNVVEKSVWDRLLLLSFCLCSGLFLRLYSFSLLFHSNIFVTVTGSIATVGFERCGSSHCLKRCGSIGRVI